MQPPKSINFLLNLLQFFSRKFDERLVREEMSWGLVLARETLENKWNLGTSNYCNLNAISIFTILRDRALLSKMSTIQAKQAVIYDIKPNMSWSIPAVAAAPVVVTRPGVKVCGLPFVDIVVLTSKNTLLYASNKYGYRLSLAVEAL
ncbi:hypothetical protein CQW23_19673 [Capsicum baccatum]|uniref:Uncharacterized protein n=1 Tax=Capsicum baccatum TaxID=33114 RepID=A0A2G2W6K0_CAPBA|nr:hypothetical protein CQW23_19673 [Capsicum baccatum]